MGGEYSDSQNYTTDYVYATPFGWAVVVVDLVLLGFYASNLKTTLLLETDSGNRAFYRKWGCVYGLWFLALPLTAVLAQAVLAPYAWYMVSLCVTNLVTVLAYVALIVGLWPQNETAHFKLGHRCADDMMEACQSPLNSRAEALAYPRLLGSSRPAMAADRKQAKF